jgi:hypothetical protein
MSNPDQLAMQVDQTRNSLSKDVARLNDRVSPARAVGTRTDKIKDSAGKVKDRLMGAKDRAMDQGPGVAKDKAGSAVGSVHDATNAAAGKLGAVTNTAALKEQTQGNPVAAGLVAFGVGWLLSSLVPVSQAEQAAAATVEDNADTLVAPLKESAQQVAGNLQEPLQNSAEALRQTTTDAVNRTTEHAKSATQDVKQQAAGAKDDVSGRLPSS